MSKAPESGVVHLAGELADIFTLWSIQIWVQKIVARCNHREIVGNINEQLWR